MKEMKLGSLFDGSGGFPLAGSLCGIEPVWAAEVEPYPIAVTRSRFPNMKHLGSVTDVHGAEVEPVDIITFGSPCQDLSVAGKRAGLKHEANGDEETTRSGLFMEAVRIIKEMREATNGECPTFAVWENVPGAFSSNKGEDFRTVLEELIKIVEPTAVMPAVPKNGWPYADSYCGNGWSLAYRTYDAQYWGVPQRRRRIYLVLDLRGQRAGKVSFEREGLRGNFATFKTAGQGTAGDAADRSGADDCEGECVGFPLGFRPENIRIYEETATTICNGTRPGFCNGVIVSYDTGENGGNGVQSVCIKECLPFDTTQVTSPQNGCNPKWGDPCHPLAAQGHPPTVICKCYDARGNGDGQTVSTLTGDHENRITDYTSVVCMATQQGGAEIMENLCPTITASAGMSGNNQPVVCMAHGQANAEILEDKSPCLNCNHEQPIIFDKEAYNSGVNANGGHYIAEGGPAQTLRTSAPPGVCVQYIVRRLTPTECARLQGFPDDWGHPDHKEDFTDEEYRFWLDVRNTHAAINGKPQKDYNKAQMLTWYNKLHTDSSEYKMWGNGISLPTAMYVMQGIHGVCREMNPGGRRTEEGQI